ncbi:MAG: DUF523 domain-containing protein [Deltaproteobacteria bacterium]|nr:DUF523 domain-containing protein [Deltaproteobacteria bacterium]
MIHIAISACLLGEPVRYDGNNRKTEHTLLDRWKAEGRLIPLCPEYNGDLPIPRPPAEIIGGDGKAVLAGKAEVINRLGDEVTSNFIDGAQKALATASTKKCRLAILTENSPSCGSSWIYDGSFSGVRIPGQGVTAALLEQYGIRIFNQYQIEQALIHLERLDQ